MLATTNTTRRSRRDAFTLVEVLVVMAIIVILAGVATMGTMKYLDTAKENVDEQRMRNLALAYRTYNTLSGGDNWPSDPSELIVPASGSRAAVLAGGVDAITNPWGNPYTVQIVPVDSGEEPYVTSIRPYGTMTIPKR